MGNVTIQKRGNYYQYKIEVAKVDGKRKFINKSGFETKEEAIKAGNLAYAEYLNTGLNFKETTISFSDYLDYWYENYCETTLKYNTRRTYKTIMDKYLKPELGKYRLSALSSVKLNSFLVELCNKYNYKKSYFRQEQAYLSVLPIMKNDIDLKNIPRRNILTSGLVSTYPFISSAIFDEDGIFIGTNIYNNSLVFVDRYDSTKYKNANICIFGTSGAGKSFYTKLLILRYRLLGIEQYIIDPDREYGELCKNLNGTLIKMGPGSNTFINIFDIRENSLEDGETGYLANKISKLIGFFNLIFGDINEEEKAILEEKLIELYRRKGITFDDNSLHKIEKNKVNIKPCFKETFDMPLLEDLCNLLGEDEKTKVFKIKLIPFVKGSLSFFNNYTNLKMDDKLVVADIYEMGEENLKYAMYVFVDYFWDRIKKDRNVKKAIYLDEIWRLIGVTSNKEVASFIYKIFKTIRKFGGSSVAITQDISDLFSLDEGIYGKSILNNSEIKTFFALEEENILLLSKYTNLSEKEKIEIKSLKRGECLMFVGNEHILTRIDAAQFEKNIIEKRNDVNNEKNNNSISKSNVK